MCKEIRNCHGSQKDKPAAENGVQSVVPWTNHYDALTKNCCNPCHTAESTVRWKSPLWHSVTNIACTIRLILAAGMRLEESGNQNDNPNLFRGTCISLQHLRTAECPQSREFNQKTDPGQLLSAKTFTRCLRAQKVVSAVPRQDVHLSAQAVEQDLLLLFFFEVGASLLRQQLMRPVLWDGSGSNP